MWMRSSPSSSFSVEPWDEVFVVNAVVVIVIDGGGGDGDAGETSVESRSSGVDGTEG